MNIKFWVACTRCGTVNKREYQGAKYPKTIVCDLCGERVAMIEADPQTVRIYNYDQ